MTQGLFARRIAAFAILFALYIASVWGPGAVSVSIAQDEADSSAYDVRADGSSFKEIDGERVIELRDNVRIVHGDVTLIGQRGVHYSVRRHTYLIGDVKATQGTLIMWGDEGEYQESTEIAILRGNVRIEDEGWVVTADELEYSRSTGHAWLRGNVVGRDSATTLLADTLFYNRHTEISEAFGNVSVNSESEGFTASGDHGFYYRSSGQGVIDRNPKLLVDSDVDEPVTVVSDTMRVYPDSGRAIAYYRVKIIKGSTITQADSAVVYDDDKRAELYGNPLARQNNVFMAGEQMMLYYDDDEIRRIDILRGAELVEEESDSLVIGGDSWMRGDIVRLHLSNNSVDSIEVSGSAESEYYPTTPGKAEHNSVKGERMFFHFANDSLIYVRVEGNASGVYRYVNISRTETIDSLRAVADTNLVYRPFATSAERVDYSAKRIEYYARNNDLVLNESAKLRYKGSELKGTDITYYSQYEMIDATGEPELTDGAQIFYGERMNYDLEGETGLVADGSTKFGEGYYTGQHVAKVEDNQMKVWKSVYTTCDLHDPHYHFKSNTMKVYPNDQVVAGPIVMYIGETPVFFLPFMAANLERDRRSGFLRPDFEVGVTSSEGRFIRNIGYYWATNDYTDFTAVSDFNENASLRMFISNRYKLRYKFDGSAEYNFFRDFNDFTNLWEVRWRHAQHEMPWGMTFNTSIHYVSDEDAPQTINRIDDVQRVIDRRIYSTANLAKSWGRQVRLSASARRAENLNVEDPAGIKLDMLLPSLTLAIPARNLYFGSASKQGQEGIWEKVLSNMRYTPTLNGNHKITESQIQELDITTINQGLSLSSNPKVSFMTFSPAISASNTTTRRDTTINAHDEQIDDSTTVVVAGRRSIDTENDFRWNASVGARTSIYGTFYPRVGRLRGLRHVFSPSVSYRYTPSRNDRPSDQLVNISMRNNFDIKVATDDSTTTEEGLQEEGVRKITNLINWSTSVTYDPDNSSRTAWSNISNSVAAQAYGVSLNVNQTIDPYQWEMLSSNVTMRFTVRGTHPLGKSDDLNVQELNVVATHDTVDALERYREGVGDVLIQETGTTPSGEPRTVGEQELEIEEGRLPWSFIVDGSYSTTKAGSPRASVRLFATMDVTKKWKLNYSTIYDIFLQEEAGQSISVTRELHCWAMSLERRRLGTEWQFYFRLELKAHPEIYGESGSRGLRGGTPGTSSFF